MAASATAAAGWKFHVLEDQIRIQANIADGEVTNSLMLLEQFVVMAKKLKKTTESYGEKLGVRLVVCFPEPLGDLMHELRRIAEMSPEFPPPDPETFVPLA